MKDFSDEMLSYLGPDAVRLLSDTIGVDRLMIEDLTPPVVQLVFSGLERQKSEHEGMDRVDHILNKHGSAKILKDLQTFLTQKLSAQNLDSSLGGLLGAGGRQAAQLFSHRFNLDSAVAGRIIPILAPVVLGFLSHQRRQIGIGLCGISAILDAGGDSKLLDDIPGSFLADQQRSVENSEVLAELLKNLSSASP